MFTRFGIILCATGLLATGVVAAQKKPVAIKTRPLEKKAAEAISYTRQIKPILVNNCLECHSPEEKKGDFDVSAYASLLKAGKKAGPGVVPGKPDESAIVQYIRGEKTPQMPKGAPALSEEELHLIRLWISAGARDDTGAPQSTSVRPLSPGAFARLDPETQASLNQLLFSSNQEQLMVARRQVRLSQIPAAPAPPKVDQATLNPIDQFIVARWKQAKLKEASRPPEICDDATFLRRVYLDLIGVVPTLQESSAFLQDPLPEKRQKLVDQLLERTDDYAAHWTVFWEEALGSSPNDMTGGIIQRGNYREWIFNYFKNNKPYDVMAASLISPFMPDYKKPTKANANGKISTIHYVLNETHTDTIQTAANVAQVFLGTGMKCASCHSHFENKEWPQARFLAFAGLFAPKDLEMIRCEKKSGQFIEAQFPFEIPGAPESVPQTPEERLHRLSQLLTDPANPRFSKTLVNRLWKRYLGLGLFEPADDFRMDRKPSHPELLEWLADDFMRHGYDLKHTIRLILNSRTYQLKYNAALEDKFNVEKPDDPRFFRSPVLRRLTAEQIIDSLRLIAEQKMPRRLYLEKSSTALTRALGRPASRNEISTSRPDDVAVVQSLELLNGQDFYQLIYDARLVKDLSATNDPAGISKTLTLAVLSRPPLNSELTETEGYLSKNPTHLMEGAGDIFWALVAGPQFQYIR